MASVSEQQAAQCASQPQDLCFGLAESLERKIAEQMKNTGNTGSTQHAKTNTPFGVKALQGTRPNMEDAYSVQMTPPPATSSGTASTAAAGAAPGAGSQAAGAEQAQAGPGTCPQQQQNLNGPSPEATVPVEEEEAANIPAPLLPEDLAVLSVFDGHGGNEVAEHCRESLHRHFAHILASSRATDDDDSCDDEASPTRQHHKKTNYHHNIIAEALRQSFLCTDQELKGTEAGDYVGATAVVAVVGKCHIIIAHAGDSRAVIQRGGKAESLTRDHKPDREDEAARIKAAGGRVVFSNGGHRVMGMLAMSRAIGDHFLRPYVIADPEVVCVERTPHDEVLVLATDGLWDVFSCKEATTLAIRCIGRSKERGMSRHGACRVAASVLTKVALERGSRDNITVIVVDIAMQKQQHQHQHHHNPPQQVVQQTQAQQQVDAALNPLHKQQLQKQQQTLLLEQVKQQLQQQTQPADGQAHGGHAALHHPPHTPTTQVQEHCPLQQQQQQKQKAEPPPTHGTSVGRNSSSSSSSTPKVPTQQQAADSAPPLSHHLSHHHHHQQHPQQHLNGNVPTSASVSATPAAPAALTTTLLAPSSLAPPPPPFAPAAPPALSATPTPPPTTTHPTITLTPPLTQLPDALLSHQQIGSHLHQHQQHVQQQQQQQQQQQHMEIPPYNVPNRSISFTNNYPQHHQPQHVHHNHHNHHHHHQPHLHTPGSCSHTTSSSSLCSHTGHAGTMEQGEGHEGSACGGGAVGSKEGRGLGGKTQSFSVGTCLWLKGHHHHHHNLHGPHPKMDAVTRAAVDRQRNAPNFYQHTQTSGSCSQLQQLQQQQQQQQQQAQHGQQHHLQLLPPAAAPPHLSPSASAAMDARTEQLEAADQAMSMPAPTTRARRPSARVLPGSGGSLDVPTPLPSASQPHSHASFFEPHAYFTEHAPSSHPPTVLLPVATTHSIQGSASSEGGPPLPPNSAAAVAGGSNDAQQGAQVHAAHVHAPQGLVHASFHQTDPKSISGSSISSTADVGMPLWSDSRGIRKAGSQSEPGELMSVPNSTKEGVRAQVSFSRSRSGSGCNEQLGGGRMGSGGGRGGGGEECGRCKSFHGDRGGAEVGAHTLGSSAIEGVVPSTTTAPPAAPRQRQIVRRPNRPAPSQPTRTVHSVQEEEQEQQQQKQPPPHFPSSTHDAPPLSSSNPSSQASPAYVSRPGTPVLPPPVAIPPTPAPSQALSSETMLSPPYPSSAPSRPGSALHQPSPLHATTFDTTTATTRSGAPPNAPQHQQQHHHHQQRQGVRSSCSSGAIEAMLGGVQGTEGVCVGDCDSRAQSESHQEQQQQQ